MKRPTLDDEIQHKVKVSKGFWIGKYPITQKQYRTIMRYNPSFFIGSNRPVDSVGEYNAKTFCLKINSLYKSKLPTNYRFVLPTEVQWEYACRANTTSTLNNGKNLYSITDIRVNLDEVGWYQLNSNSTTHPVGQKKPNSFGLFDMIGNVWEFTSTERAGGIVSCGGSWDNSISDKLMKNVVGSSGNSGSRTGLRLCANKKQ